MSLLTAEERIRLQVEHWNAVGHPALMERFVLRNGRAMTATGEKFRDRMTPKQCFTNATQVVSEWAGTYVEGYAVRNDIPILIHHAWVMMDDGKAFDPTLEEPESYQYFGVPFETDVLWDEINRTGYYGLLDQGHGINIEFMLQRDPGMEEFLPDVMKYLGRKP